MWGEVEGERVEVGAGVGVKRWLGLSGRGP